MKKEDLIRKAEAAETEKRDCQEKAEKIKAKIDEISDKMEIVLAERNMKKYTELYKDRSDLMIEKAAYEDAANRIGAGFSDDDVKKAWADTVEDHNARIEKLSTNAEKALDAFLNAFIELAQQQNKVLKERNSLNYMITKDLRDQYEDTGLPFVPGFGGGIRFIDNMISKDYLNEKLRDKGVHLGNLYTVLERRGAGELLEK